MFSWNSSLSMYVYSTSMTALRSMVSFVPVHPMEILPPQLAMFADGDGL